MSNFFRDIFDRVRGHEKPTIIGGYATHSAGELASWLGLGCLIFTVAGILIFVLTLLVAFQFASWLTPFTGNVQQKANEALQNSAQWLEQNLDKTEEDLKGLQQQVDDLNKQVDTLKEQVQQQSQL